MTLCCVAGLSGGHIIPGITYTHTLSHNRAIFFVTTKSLDKTIVHTHAPQDRHIFLPIENIPYTRPLRLPLFCLKFVWSCIKSMFYLAYYRPKKIISMGGIVSLPVCTSGILLRIPIELFELNVVPGKASRLIAPWSYTISLCFEKTKSYFDNKKCILTDYPLRKHHKNSFNTDFVHKKLHFNQTKKTIFILSGSQGSKFINHFIQKWLITNPTITKNIQYIHQVGADDLLSMRTWYAQHGYHAYVFNFEPNIWDYYCFADGIVCRSGAGTLFEIAKIKKPCLTIPLKTAYTNHQVDNAHEMSKKYDFISILHQKTIEQNPMIAFKKLEQMIYPANYQV